RVPELPEPRLGDVPRQERVAEGGVRGGPVAQEAARETSHLGVVADGRDPSGVLPAIGLLALAQLERVLEDLLQAVEALRQQLEYPGVPHEEAVPAQDPDEGAVDRLIAEIVDAELDDHDVGPECEARPLERRDLVQSVVTGHGEIQDLDAPA